MVRLIKSVCFLIIVGALGGGIRLHAEAPFNFEAGAGHLPTLERPMETMSALRRWLEE